MMFKLITTGYFYADGGAMFGAIPKATWNRSYPSDKRNLCVLAMHAGVVKTEDGHTIVVDPGVGLDRLHDSPAVYYRFFDMIDIAESLRKIGIALEEVTDVVLTHLHFDHCGAAIQTKEDGSLTPLFPNAAHWVSRAQYETERNPHPLEADAFLPKNTEILNKAGLLRLVEATIEPCDSMRIELYDGHTMGQVVAFIKAGEGALCAGEIGEMGNGAMLVFTGDVVPLASHIIPERISAYDLYPTCSYDGKVSLLEKATSKDAIFVFYHDAYTACATLKKTGNYYKIAKKIDR